MGDQMITAIVSVATAIVGVAILAVIVSRNSNTANVIAAGGKAFSGSLATALSPVVGGNSLTLANMPMNSTSFSGF